MYISTNHTRVLIKKHNSLLNLYSYHTTTYIQIHYLLAKYKSKFLPYLLLPIEIPSNS